MRKHTTTNNTFMSLPFSKHQAEGGKRIGRMLDGGRWLPAACGSLAPALIPPAHIAVLWYFWQSYSRYVDKRFCSCSCWDTVFKGPYESGIASYKHMYFNATPNTMKMWLLTVVSIIALYECIKQLIVLIIQNRCRYSMLVLFSLSIFSHYYAWWAYMNYYNDEYYEQWNHQLFFTVSIFHFLYIFQDGKIIDDDFFYTQIFFNQTRNVFQQLFYFIVHNIYL